jgi:hypothetical protein
MKAPIQTIAHIAAVVAEMMELDNVRVLAFNRDRTGRPTVHVHDLADICDNLDEWTETDRGESWYRYEHSVIIAGVEFFEITGTSIAELSQPPADPETADPADVDPPDLLAEFAND